MFTRFFIGRFIVCVGLFLLRLVAGALRQSPRRSINLVGIRDFGFRSAGAGDREVPVARFTVLPVSWKQTCTRIGLVAVLTGCWFIPQTADSAPANTLYWDIVGGSPNGAWNSTSGSWSISPFGGGQIPWVNGSNAVFSAIDLNATGNFTVTLATNVSVGDLTYTGGGLGSILQIAAGPAANTITIAASPMNVMVDPFTTLVVAAKIVGVGRSLVLQGPSTLPTLRTLEALPGFPGGTLVLTGANSYTGGTTILSGILQLGDDSATGSIIGAVTNDDTFNIVNANTAGISAITNNNLGTTNFLITSTAANAVIINNGGFTTFNNTSTAGTAAITSNGGQTEFFDNSTAGFATITTNGSGFTEFFDHSTAANAMLINNSGGETEFNITSTAGFATIINNQNGFTNFKNASTAEMAAITNNGGVTEFFDSSTAGNSTITTNVDGETLFFATSTGGQARLITNAGGMVDISGLTSVGMTAGSIEGAGTYLLGAKSLTVGSNNLSTTVSGVIEDGGLMPASNLASGTGGSLIKVGTGTMTLTGLNTYSGGTSFNGGIVAVNRDANLGAGPLNFNGGGLQALATGGGLTTGKAITLNAGGGIFLADAGTISTFTAAISGAGSLTKDGPGTLDLTGVNIYQGGTVLNAGTLTVHSGQALGLGNVTVNGGILRADPQPINVKGNYTQTAGTLQLQVVGGKAGQYDTLNVGGNAALGGTLQLISQGFHPKAGDQLTLVSTGGVVSGHFAQFIDPFTAGPGLALGGLIYGPNSVLLDFQSAAAFALTPNQRGAARLLDAVQLDPRAANLISFFNQESLENLPGDFQKISPDGLTAFYEISFSNANIQRLNLEDRLDEVRNGSNGFSSNMKVNGATVNLENRVDADGKSAKNVVEPVLQHAPENRWGVWVTGFGDFVSVDADGNANGYNFTTGGVSLGLDYRITEQLAIGVMGEYSHTWTGLNPSGHIDVDSGRGGLYATWFAHGMYLNAAVYGGYNSFNSNRSGLGGLASGNTQGAEWSTFVSGGYDFHFAQLTIGPIAALQYTSVNVDGFSENGSLAPLAIHEGSAESLRSDVGLRAFYQWQIGQMVIEPSVKAAWEHEYKYSALPITAGFAQIPGPSATFFGPNEGHDSAVISAGVNVQLTPAISTYVNYDGQLGRDHYNSNAVTGGVRFKF